MSDDIMQWYAEIGQREEEEQREAREEMDRLCRLLEEHRQWKRDFEAGLTTTNERN